MLVGILSQDISEPGRAGGEDHFVGLDLFVIAGKGHVEEVLVLSQLSEGHTDVAFKIIPPQTKLLCTPHFTVRSLTPVGLLLFGSV